MSLTSLKQDPVRSEPETTQWFVREVHVHEPSLKSYLKGQFPTVQDVDDVVQESYLRIWKVRAAQPIKSARAFLFTVARHLALDLVRRKKVSPIVFPGDLTQLSVVEDRAGVLDTLTEQEKISLVGDAIVALPERIRVIFLLYKFQELPQSEIARRLGVSEKIVEHQVARGMELCERFLRARGHELF